jgi:hypothetical protein
MISLANTSGDSDEHFKLLDLSGLRFPSDRLSIRVLRERHPDLFDLGFADADDSQPRFFFDSDKKGHAEDTVGSMLQAERMIAVSAYAARAGIAPRKLYVSIDDVKEQLSGLYVEYGIASGSHHAAELIRDIERQAVELANQRHP